MKLVSLSLVLFTGAAIACPGDSSTKDASAPAVAKPAVEAKAPQARPTSAKAVAAKPVTKVADKATVEARKTAPM